MKKTILSLIILSTMSMLFAVNITFQVNMSTWSDGATDSTSVMHIRGSFNGWSDGNLLTNVGGDYWSTTIDLTAGDTVEYKFTHTEGTVLSWESISNRSYVVPASDTVVDLAYFDDIAPYTPTSDIDVYFRVNMVGIDAFNDDIIEVRGSFNGWTGGDTLFQESSASDFWSGVISIAAATADTIEYKFTYGTGPGWESISNRSANCTQDTTLAWKWFNDQPVSDLDVFVDVTFQLDMTNETVSANGVHVAGGMQGWDPSTTELTDTDGDDIYTVTLSLQAGTEIQYTYLNGDTWGDQEDNTGLAWCGADNGFGAYNRVNVIDSTDYSLPVVCFSSCIGCDEVFVTYQVDMSNETVSANGVHVAGSMQGWDPGATELTLNDSTGYYEVSLPGTVGDTIQYKYINGNAWGDDESAPDDCSYPGSFGNRWLVVPAIDVATPGVCFASCLACDAVYVTFQVDMKNEEISTDGIHIAGSFQGWDPASTELTDADGDSIYEVTVGLASGVEVLYKFVNGNAWGSDETVPSDCSTDGNRTFTPGTIDITVDAVCFASCGTCVPVNYQTATVTFQADIGEMVTFDPAVHTLEIRGGMNGWSGGSEMQQDLVNPYLYILDIEFEENVGNEVQWKFKANPDSAWNNSGWEVGDNHTFVWTGDNIVLDVLQPNILPTGAPLESDVTLYFEVEWIDGTLNNNSGEAFLQKPDTIVFNGSFINGWYTWGDCMGSGCSNPASNEMPHLADGDGDNIFTGSLVLPEGHSNLFTSKFGAWYSGIENDVPGTNGAIDNEAGFGQDRNVIVPLGVTEYTYVTRFGENNPDNPWLGIIKDSEVIPDKFALLDNYPNPFNPSTRISFSLPNVADVQINIYNVLGEQIATLHKGHLDAGVYNFIWHGRDQNGASVASGIYFYELQAGNQFHKIKKMTLMK